ncbi:MAG: flagellar export chaperone FliS [Woeseiaceae bacterium]|nr:flagellar export chaperone FliS [Woeseiaceae bacterium]
MNHSVNAAAANQYRSVGIQHDVANASPHRLIQLLMERFITKVAMGRRHMQAGDVAEKGETISHAISIVDCLRASLNHETDADLSGNFDALYDYMSRRLLESNLHDDIEGLDEVVGLMREIKSAWDAIADEVASDPETLGPAA